MAARQAFVELDAPARVSLLGLEERGLLRPFGNGVGATEVLAVLGLVFGVGLCVLHQVFAQHHQQVVAVVDHHE